MEPKFQSSFIPKNPTAFTATGAAIGRRVEGRGLLSTLALIIFTVSILSALGVFGYKFYLKYNIDKMGADLEKARATLQPETISELTRLNDRLVLAKDLIANHRALTPLFEFLEISTPVSVRFSDFRYSVTDQGLELFMRGEARGYAALALQADIFSKSQYLGDFIFSDLSLNERGDVTFSFKTIIDPDKVSYEKMIGRADIPSIPPVSGTAATSTSSVSPSQAATSTQN